MQRSTDRILTTHTGSLSRPAGLEQMLHARDRDESVDEAAFEAEVVQATADVVRRQVRAGIDVVNDGEMGKVGYATYVRSRLTGFDGRLDGPGVTGVPPDLMDFPGFSARFAQRLGEVEMPAVRVCDGPIDWKDEAAGPRDIGRLKAAVDGLQPREVFMTAASPGVVALFLPNAYYPTYEAYIGRLAEVMKAEYEAIASAGFVLQVDCPDLAGGRHSNDDAIEAFMKRIELHIEALNYALSEVPPEQSRIHLCWGNYEGPHHHDVPLAEIIQTVLKVRASGLVFEAANPRHAHEWAVFEDVKLPDGKVLVPGVLDTCTNYIEHPDLIAERICRYANLVGAENVIAGTDCGFSTFAGVVTVDPDIAWAKLEAMVEGARRASARLW